MEGVSADAWISATLATNGTLILFELPIVIVIGEASAGEQP